MINQISKEQYLEALHKGNILHRDGFRFLEAWQSLPNRIATATALSKVLNTNGVAPINNIIGAIGNGIADYLNIKKVDESGSPIKAWRFLATGVDKEYFEWTMHEALSEAFVEFQSSITQKHAKWDYFLQQWPIERIHSMSIEEYTGIGDKTTLTNFLEFGTRELGSIKGGSSFKFGIFKRGNSDKNLDEKLYGFTSEYAWLKKYGDSADEAFLSIKSIIIKIIEAAKSGNHAVIDELDLGNVVKWKLAFLYQPKDDLSLLCIYSRELLNGALRLKKKLPFSELNKRLMDKREGRDIFEYSEAMWSKAKIEQAANSSGDLIDAKESSNAWLLSWNPEKWSAVEIDKDNYSLALAAGDTLSWRCKSKHPQIGDTAYIIRTSVDPRGIVAKAKVILESYESTGDEKTASVIDIEILQVREDCASGLLPSILLNTAIPAQHWSTQASGIAIKPANLEILNKLWLAGEGISSLAQFVNWCSQDKEFKRLDWLESYQNITSKVASLKNKERALDNDLLQLIWKTPANGVSNVSPGFISNEDFENNEQFLQESTLSILKSPTKETGAEVFQQWEALKSNDKMRQIYRGVIHRVFSAVAPDKYITITKESNTKKLLQTFAKDFQLSNTISNNWFVMNAEIKRCMVIAGLDDDNLLQNNKAMWQLYAAVHEPDRFSPEVGESEEEYDASLDSTKDFKVNNLKKQPLNQILYGPPGTGKTFNTINQALAVLEPNLDLSSVNRSELKAKFDEYTSEGRIYFVTFHQSFSYEDFVEGLRASSDQGGISYSVEPGVFKRACNQARSLPGSSMNAFDIAMDRLLEYCENLEQRLEIETVRGKKFAIEYVGGETFKVFPHSTENQNPNYVASIENVRKLYTTGSKKGLYNTSYVEGLLNYLKSEFDLPPYQEITVEVADTKPVVLIIDEINRGNISSIFGELITLIEPSKRAGAKEALSVILPYSKETFSVPENLHIIGTMNTADRSLALMDTALRRRFDFVEMMPQPELLSGVIVKGINIEQMLERMNRRIEVLYDREHTLGHAFFMSLVTDDLEPNLEQSSEDDIFNELQSIFANKVLPLLEEYFFEDWEKIRLVLGDNQKQGDEEELQFITELSDGYDSSSLFGDTELDSYALGTDDIKVFVRNDKALKRVEAYKGIYA